MDVQDVFGIEDAPRPSHAKEPKADAAKAAKWNARRRRSVYLSPQQQPEQAAASVPHSGMIAPELFKAELQSVPGTNAQEWCTAEGGFCAAANAFFDSAALNPHRLTPGTEDLEVRVWRLPYAQQSDRNRTTGGSDSEPEPDSEPNSEPDTDPEDDLPVIGFYIAKPEGRGGAAGGGGDAGPSSSGGGGGQAAKAPHASYALSALGTICPGDGAGGGGGSSVSRAASGSTSTTSSGSSSGSSSAAEVLEAPPDAVELKWFRWSQIDRRFPLDRAHWGRFGLASHPLSRKGEEPDPSFDVALGLNGDPGRSHTVLLKYQYNKSQGNWYLGGAEGFSGFMRQHVTPHLRRVPVALHGRRGLGLRPWDAELWCRLWPMQPGGQGGRDGQPPLRTYGFAIIRMGGPGLTLMPPRSQPGTAHGVAGATSPPSGGPPAGPAAGATAVAEGGSSRRAATAAAAVAAAEPAAGDRPPATVRRSGMRPTAQAQGRPRPRVHKLAAAEAPAAVVATQTAAAGSGGAGSRSQAPAASGVPGAEGPGAGQAPDTQAGEAPAAGAGGSSEAGPRADAPSQPPATAEPPVRGRWRRVNPGPQAGGADLSGSLPASAPAASQPPAGSLQAPAAGAAPALASSPVPPSAPIADSGPAPGPPQQLALGGALTAAHEAQPHSEPSSSAALRPPAHLLSPAHLAPWNPRLPPLPAQPDELPVCGLVFPPDLAPAAEGMKEEWEGRHPGWRSMPAYDQVDASGAPAQLQPLIAASLPVVLGIAGERRGNPLPKGPVPGPEQEQGQGQRPGASGSPPSPLLRLEGDGRVVAARALRRGQALGVVGGYVLPARDAQAYAEGGFEGCSAEARQELDQRSGGACIDAAWALVAGAARLPYPGLKLPRRGAAGPEPLELSALGYGSVAGAARDVRAAAEGGATEEAAPAPNCEVFPVCVRGLALPVLVALRDVGAGGELVWERGAEWWGRLQFLRNAVEGLGDGTWARRLLGIPVQQ
ncbi:hypothetical protein HYH03_005945 [Edaphochlamys debaryana]|uniref:Uncharacterized protein n=1 Tax=Edaphochlamys debaryana TaxID=47281 RepID=A0A835Y4W4_9CHLO|nr:hypothetical protein HYH03_005945 [Edaphochlamys debaryana]|eukprot:KAG2496023.1 hypothetical protein HYH03_005945 [Edaphochlamys debaryana]